MRSLPIAAALFALAATGCKTAPDPAAPVTTPVDTASNAPDAVPATGAVVDAVTMEGNDQMRFTVNTFTVKAGTQVSLTLRNAGQLPKETFGHNVVILKQGIAAKTYADVAMNAKDTDFIPADRAGDVIAHTKLLGPGESDTITFTAPTEPGTYVYICSFPGHYMTMQGTMQVVA